MTESSTNTNPKYLLLLLLAVILLPLSALLIGIHRADVTRHMEALTLETSQETWMRQHAGESNACLLPSRNGKIRVRKPPATAWMNMLAWSGLTPDNSEPDDLILRGRLMGIGLALVMLAATFWMGCLIRGPTLGFGAALVVASTHAFLDQARIDSYDTQLMAWCAVAVACGLQSILGSRRKTLFIVFGGIAAALAFLTKGPVSLIHTALPLLAMGAVIQQKRAATMKSLIGIIFITMLLAPPWYIYLALSQQDVASTLFTEYQAERAEFQPPWYYLGLLGMVLPWTFWLVNGLFTPFDKHNKQIKTKLLLPWAWFAAVFVAMSIPGAKQQRYIIPILPAFGLLVANAWLQADFRNRSLRVLRSIHWGVLVAASILLPIYMILQTPLMNSGVIDKLDFPDASPWIAIPVGILLVAVAVVGYLLQKSDRKIPAMIATAVWMITAFTAAYNYYTNSYHAVYEQRADCERVTDVLDGAELHYLQSPPPPKVSPDEKFLLYTREIFPGIAPEKLKEQKPAFIMTRQTEKQQMLVEEMGYRHVFDFHDGRLPRSLYKLSMDEKRGNGK